MGHKSITEQWENVTGKNLSIANFVTGFLAYGAMLVWLNANFISTAKGEHIQIKIEDNYALIVDFKDEYRIKNAMADVRALKYMRDDLEEKELRDGKSDLLTDRRQENKIDLEAAMEYKDCLMLPLDTRPKCQFLVK